MDIDLNILRTLEREKEISFEILVEAIEQALLTAYHKTSGAQEKARVELDRKTGHVTVLAAETDEEGNVVAEYDDTPQGFGRIGDSDDDKVLLEVDGEQRELPYADIAKARVQIEFNRRRDDKEDD